MELQVRHLESGTVVYRCQGRAVGAPPIDVGAGEALQTSWAMHANLGRGHYAVTAALLNEHHRWIAVSAPALLTVNERQSEQSVVYLSASCRARVLASREGEPARS
jgi:hypothetical protein